MFIPASVHASSTVHSLSVGKVVVLVLALRLLNRIKSDMKVNLSTTVAKLSSQPPLALERSQGRIYVYASP
jgi:hypothetical protein